MLPHLRRKPVLAALGALVAACIGITLFAPWSDPANDTANGPDADAAALMAEAERAPPTLTEPRLRLAALEAMATRQTDALPIGADDVHAERTAVAKTARNLAEAAPGAGIAVRTLAVRAGDTIGRILADAGVSADSANNAIEALRAIWDPRELKPRQAITLMFAAAADAPEAASLHAIKLQTGIDRDVVVSRTEDGFVAREEERRLSRELTRAAGTIEDSLFASAAKAGVPPPVLIEMVRAFSYDVDFQRDIHSGDKFEIMFETVSQEDGSPVAYGPPLYAAVSTGGELVRLYRYTPKSGTADYFNVKGEGVKKALLRTPIDGARLTSRFGPRRHPVLGYTRMHRGVDFGAASGTPIYAAGDGVVAFAGRRGNFGNFIELRHAGEHSTTYSHLSKFAKGLRTRARVKQGQVIGYVGSTGLSTGPHLHYEVHRDGKQINPMNVKFAASEKLAGVELKRFQEARANIEYQFARTATEIKLAQNQKN